jgi:flagellar biosynthesis anti-sigma factor FlgM
MEIRNSLEGLNSLLGVNATDASAERGKGQGASSSTALGIDHATLSSAASQMAHSADDPGVRMEKINGIQVAIADGTYSAPASVVASKLVDSMLSGK